MATKAPKMPKAARKAAPNTQPYNAAAVMAATAEALVEASTKPAIVEYSGPVNISAIKRITTDRLVDESEPGEIDRLATSMSMHGLLQPIGLLPITKVGESATGGTDYAIVYGRRRFLAARKLGWTSIDARVYKPGSAEQEIVLRETENLQRKDLNPIEEAAAVASLLDYSAVRLQNRAGSADWGSAPIEVRKKAVAIVASQIGKPERWVRDRAFLTRLDEPIRDQVLSGKLPIGHAREIARLADPEIRRQAAKRCFAYDGRLHALEDVADWVAGHLFSLAQVSWKLGVAFAGKPACAECPHNSANQPGLFEHEASHSRDPKSTKSWDGQLDKEPKCGVCTSPSCYAVKAAEASKQIASLASGAARASREAKPKDRAKAEAQTIAAKLPAFIPQAAVVARLEEKAQAAKVKRSKDRAHPPSTTSHQPSIEVRVENEYRDLMRKRLTELSRLADAHFQKAPRGVWAMFQLACMSKPWQAAAQWNLKSSLKALASKEWKALCEAVAKPPTIENVVALEKLCGTRYGVIDAGSSRGYQQYGAAEGLLAALGVTLPEPAPTLESLLAKAKGEKAESVKPAAPAAPKETPKSVAAKKPKKTKPIDDFDADAGGDSLTPGADLSALDEEDE